ncbi:MAG TPA: DUF1080 domain-containing protein [Ohtaekwangia sp.]|nr:DUF1080 domain-containing protein [Ohtaekwangia sp.]
MSKNLLIVIFSAIWFSCGTQKAEQTSTETDETQPNTLSTAQAEEGWRLLFDGKTMNGWRVFRNAENNSWEVVDGTLHCKPFADDATNHRSDLVTGETWEDFELSFEWKISAQGNSGVIFRVSEEFEQPYASGPEYQIIDNEGYPGDLQPAQHAGANYDMHVPSKDNANPPGEWNTGRIVAKGNHIEHWLNGEKVVEYDIHSDDWNQRREASKWKDFPGYAMTKKGHIDLQDHGNEVWFRSIMIKPL